MAGIRSGIRRFWLTLSFLCRIAAYLIVSQNMVGESIDVDLTQYSESLRVERDVIFFFHQQADYAFLTDDLDYTMFPEKYWEVLVRESGMKAEIQDGCLALLFAMGSYESGNVGVALGPFLPECLCALRRFEPPSIQTNKVRAAAILALSIAATPQHDRDWEAVKNLQIEAEWIHKLVVRNYFRSRALSFESVG